MSWGLKITIVYIAFVSLIVSMVIISSSNKSELVAKDYYAQELAYQEKIDAISNEKALSSSINYEINDEYLIISMKPSEIMSDFKGEVFLFRASDASKDLRLDMKFNSKGCFLINKKQLTKGVYKMCISWSSKSNNYYKENLIHI
jgi:hypothetical protein